jgi:hypothetical protein
MTPQGALNLIRRLEDGGTLTEHERVPGRSKRWVADAVLNVLEGSSDPNTAGFTVRDDCQKRLRSQVNDRSDHK